MKRFFLISVLRSSANHRETRPAAISKILLTKKNIKSLKTKLLFLFVYFVYTSCVLRLFRVTSQTFRLTCFSIRLVSCHRISFHF